MTSYKRLGITAGIVLGMVLLLASAVVAGLIKFPMQNAPPSLDDSQETQAVSDYSENKTEVFLREESTLSDVTDTVDTADTEKKIIEVQEQSSSCGINFAVAGGSFSPDLCRVEIISGGVPCEDPKECKPGYALNLRDNKATFDTISSVVLYNIGSFETGTYTFNPEASAEEFQGALTDKGAISRHLLRGTLTLDPRAQNTAYVSFDLLFAGDISLKGSGVVGVERVNAP